MAPAQRLALVGRIEVVTSAGSPRFLRGVPGEIAAYLGLHRGSINRLVLARQLFPDLSDTDALRRLRTGISHLRQSLGIATPGRDSVSLPRHIEVDVERFDRPDDLQPLDELIVGELAPAVESAWIDAERTRVAILQAKATSLLLERLERKNDEEGATRVATRVLEWNPYHYDARMALVRALLRNNCVRLARRELNRLCDLRSEIVGSEVRLELDQVPTGAYPA